MLSLSMYVRRMVVAAVIAVGVAAFVATPSAATTGAPAVQGTNRWCNSPATNFTLYLAGLPADAGPLVVRLKFANGATTDSINGISFDGRAAVVFASSDFRGAIPTTSKPISATATYSLIAIGGIEQPPFSIGAVTFAACAPWTTPVKALPWESSVGQPMATVSWSKPLRPILALRLCWDVFNQADPWYIAPTPLTCHSYVDLPATATSRTVKLPTGAANYPFRLFAKETSGWTYNAPGDFLSGTLTSITAPANIVSGSTVKVSSVLRQADVIEHLPVAGVPARLYRHLPGQSWTLVATVTTTSLGAASWTGRQTTNTYYQWRFAGHDYHAGALSPTRLVNATFRVSATPTSTSVRHRSQLAIYGSVSPYAIGQPVYLQQYSAGAWRRLPVTATIARQLLPNGSTAVGYVLKVTPSTAGTFAYRVEKPGNSLNAGGYSRYLPTTVT